MTTNNLDLDKEINIFGAYEGYGSIWITKRDLLKAVLPILREITNQEIDVTGHGLMSRKGDYYTADTFLDALSHIVQEEDMEEKK